MTRIQLANEIRTLETEISMLEQKRSRSQAALLDAILDGTEPAQDDADFFRVFTAEIEYKREKLKELYKKRGKYKNN